MRRGATQPGVQIYEFCPTFTGTVTNSTGSEDHEIEGRCRLYRVSSSCQGWRPHFIDLTIGGESEFHVSEDGLTIIDGESELSVFENGEIGGNEACDDTEVPSSVMGLMTARWEIALKRVVRFNE